MVIIKDVKFENNIIEAPPLEVSLEPKGVGYAIYNSMLKYKDKVFQIDSMTRETDTYGSILQRCIRTALKMQSLGITSDDIITIFSTNHFNMVVPYFAALFNRTAVTAIDAELSSDEIVYLLKEVTPKYMFISTDCIELLDETFAKFPNDIKVVVFGESEKYMDFAEFLEPNEGKDSFEPDGVKSLFETAVMYYTSGLTGLPKAVCITHYAILGQVTNLLNYGICFDRIVSTCSLHWCTVLGNILAVVFTGSVQIVVPIFEFEDVFDAIHNFKPTMLQVDAAMLHGMVEERPDYVDLTTVRQLIPGGTAVSLSLTEKIEKMFPNAKLLWGYGQTEFFSFTLNFKLCLEKEAILRSKNLNSCGRPVPGFSYKIVDPNSEKVLGPNQKGELRIKSKYAPNGYYNYNSTSYLDSEGWYKTRDILYYDEDFCFYFVECLKEMLKYQDWHVSPKMIENVLFQHPAVTSALVIGIPNEIDGEHPMALVVLKENFQDTKPEDIEKFNNDQMDYIKQIRAGVKIVKSIPDKDRKTILKMVLNREL